MPAPDHAKSSAQKPARKSVNKAPKNVKQAPKATSGRAALKTGKKAPKAMAKKAPKAVAPKAMAKKAPKAMAKKAPKAVAKKAPKAVAKKAPKLVRPRAKAEPTLSRAARQALSQKRAIAAALAPAVDGTQIVDAYMRDVDHPFKQEMQAVREIILGASPKILERIKWNAPSFYYKEDLGAFHPRATEYAHLILLFPDGKGMDDSSGLLEGNHKDRREAKFYSMDDVLKKKPALEKLVKSWVARRG